MSSSPIPSVASMFKCDSSLEEKYCVGGLPKPAEHLRLGASEQKQVSVAIGFAALSAHAAACVP